MQTSFVKNHDTIATLKQGDRVVVRTYIECTKDAEYIMVDIPIPAGCVQANKSRGSYIEANRENYKDRTVIYCNRMSKGVYVFDVELQARYKGSFSVNPASASMMYYPEQYGNNEVKRIGVR